MLVKCSISGKQFEISDKEKELRERLGVQQLPSIAPEFRIRHLGSFWPHFHLHQRKCDGSGKKIISTYSDECPYPVWHKDYWVKNSNPPQAEFDFNRNVFEQMWELFQKCPLPHNIGVGNENCEYTDDWFYSKNCFLSHSGFKDEDVRYSYRARNSSDCEFVAFCFDCELCVDVVNSRNCFNVIYALNCRTLTDSAFCYDCRNCTNCLFCSNLRGQKYCIANKQYSKEDYEKELAKWDFSSRTTYEKAKDRFFEMMREHAWHRALSVDNCTGSTGNYLENAGDCENCFFINGSEDCVNSVRSVSGKDKTCLDGVAHFGGELLYNVCTAQDGCYDVKSSYNLINCSYAEYCANCLNCKNCFGCAGLVNQKFHIFNKAYSENDYHKLKSQIINLMKEQGNYGKFFPGYFSPVAYDESWSAVHFLLEHEEQKSLGFRVNARSSNERPDSSLDASEVPDSPSDADASIENHIYWDPMSKKPFRITKTDLAFANKMKTPLNNTYYTSRLKENFCWMQYEGSVRETKCSKSGVEIKTGWPEVFDSRILSEDEYLKIIA